MQVVFLNLEFSPVNTKYTEMFSGNFPLHHRYMHALYINAHVEICIQIIRGVDTYIFYIFINLIIFNPLLHYVGEHINYHKLFTVFCSRNFFTKIKIIPVIVNILHNADIYLQCTYTFKIIRVFKIEITKNSTY